MRLSTPAQMKEIERLAALEFDISDEILMEVAGSLSAREVQLSYLPELSRGKIAVLCGTGNNGGDALVLARHLFSQGFLAIEVFLIGDMNASSELNRVQFSRAKKSGIKLTQVSEASQVKGFDVYVDGVFGTGISRPLEGLSKEVIEVVNTSTAPVVSLDIPSGLNALNGNIYGEAVRADMTLTYGLGKPGLYVSEGPAYSGRVRVLQIGFPRRLLRQVAQTHFSFNEKLARRWLPVRNQKSNKAQHGHLLVAAGKPGMWGAASLCCEAAYRIGAGYVTLATSDKNASEKYLGKDLGSEVLVGFREDSRILEKKTAVVVGPGAGVDQNLQSFIERLIDEKKNAVVVDADGLTVLSEMKGVKLSKTWVLTPHSGELSRLLNVDVKDINEDRFYFASLAAKKFGCNILLKGFRSVIADPFEHLAIITSGNAALAKAGTGDVLSGMIGGLMAQGLGTVQAAGTAAYIHGRLSDDWVRLGHDIRGFIPRDLISAMPTLIGHLNRE